MQFDHMNQVKIKYLSQPGGGGALVEPVDWQPDTSWCEAERLSADGFAIWDDDEQVAGLAHWLGGGGLPDGEHSVDISELVWLQTNVGVARVFRDEVEVNAE